MDKMRVVRRPRTLHGAFVEIVQVALYYVYTTVYARTRGAWYGPINQELEVNCKQTGS